MRVCPLVVMVAAAIWLGPSVHADEPAAQDQAARVDTPDLTQEVSNRRLEEIVTKVDPKFWGAVLVARRGEPLLMKGFGRRIPTARPRSPGAERITPTTLFDIASISKPLTATAVLMLEHDGKLSLDDPIEKFFPEHKGGPSGITLRHLITHTPGRDPEGVSVPYAEPSDLVAFRNLLAAKRVYTPGERYIYTNQGYGILASVIQRASGMTFEHYMNTRVFGPMGMIRTGFPVDPDLDRTDASARANVTVLDHPGGWGWGARGLTGVCSCLADVLKWDRELREPSAVLPEIVKRMQTWTVDTDRKSPSPPKPGAEPEAVGYGIGWFIDRHPKLGTVVFHTGATRGYSAIVERYPDKGIVIAVLTSQTGKPHQLAWALREVVAREFMD